MTEDIAIFLKQQIKTFIFCYHACIEIKMQLFQYSMEYLGREDWKSNTHPKKSHREVTRTRNVFCGKNKLKLVIVEK